jgi:hypothetical protein
MSSLLSSSSASSSPNPTPSRDVDANVKSAAPDAKADTTKKTISDGGKITPPEVARLALNHALQIFSRLPELIRMANYTQSEIQEWTAQFGNNTFSFFLFITITPHFVP